MFIYGDMYRYLIMWVARIKFDSASTLIGSKLPLYGVDVIGYPLSYQYERGHITVQLAGTIFGKEDNKQEFIRDLRKESRVVDLELSEDFLIVTVKEPCFAEVIYNQSIIHVKPAILSSQGYEIIQVASHTKEPLTRIIALLKEKYDGELLWIRQQDIHSISVMTIRAELTQKQREAFELAVRQGYYAVPRKTSVQKLAEMSSLSFATYQVHLRKAESKLLPSVLE